MCASPCGFVRGVCAWRPAVSAVLSRRFARRASGLTALSRLFASVHACLFSFVRKKETACDALRFYSAGRDRHSCVLAVLARLSGLAGSLRVCAFLYGDPDGLPGTRGHGATRKRGWRRGLCALLRGRIGLVGLSAGSTLGLKVEAALRPPQTAPKSLRLSGLSSGAGRVRECVLRGGLCWCVFAPPSPGYTESPARL